MKRIVWLMTFVMVAFLVPGLAFAGGAPDQSGGGTKTVAEKETYIFAGGWWAYPVWKQLKYGFTKGAEYLNSLGANIEVKFVGPLEGDMDQIYAGLQQAIAQKPTGIMYLCALGLNEGPIIDAYRKAGGLVWGFGGAEGDFKIDGLPGSDNTFFGRTLAERAIQAAGKTSFEVVIQTIQESPDHIARVQGIKEVFSKYPEIKILGYLEEGPTVEQATAGVSAFLAAHPEVDVFLGTASLTGMEAATALREAGIGPGEKVVICSDISTDILAGIKSGYVTGTVGQQFGQEAFWALIGMHLQHTNPVPLTKNDAATGFKPGPYRLIMPNPWIDKSNVAVWETLNEME